jgi:hypothetical protein
LLLLLLRSGPAVAPVFVFVLGSGLREFNTAGLCMGERQHGRTREQGGAGQQQRFERHKCSNVKAWGDEFSP